MTLYNLQTPPSDPSALSITKWDSWGNIESTYLVSSDACTCPAGHRHTCRHRQMLPHLLPILDTHWFLDWDNGALIVDFKGNLKSNLDALISPATPADLPAEEDTKSRTSAKPWRRI